MNEWDEYARQWDTDPATRRYAELAFSTLLPVLERHATTLTGARVLDFGCGTGLLTEHLISVGAAVDVFDTSDGMLRVLAAKLGDRVDVRILAELPERPKTYDLVVCSSVCAFLDDYPATAAALAGVLRDGGVFVQWDWERHETDAGEHGLTAAQICQALTTAGLVDVVVQPSFRIEVSGQAARPLIGSGRKPLGSPT